MRRFKITPSYESKNTSGQKVRYLFYKSQTEQPDRRLRRVTYKPADLSGGWHKQEWPRDMLTVR